MIDTNMKETLGDMLNSLRSKWKWFVGIGVLVLILGLLALGNTFIATVASIYFIGVVMIMAGILEIIHAFQVRTWSNALFLGGCGLIYTFAGIIAIANPLMASAALTLCLAVALIIIGAVRTWNGLIMMKQYTGSGWVIFSGILSLLLGLIIVAGWPINGLWIIGLFLGVDLLFQGWAYLLFGLSIRTKS